MLSQICAANVENIRQSYPDAEFVAVMRGKSICKYSYREYSLVPSKKLIAEYNKSQQTKDDWEQFALKFSEEMKLHVPSVAILRIAKRAQSKDIFLVSNEGPSCGERCHRFLLLNLIGDVSKENGFEIKIRR
jgi:uncharacterized protein YeaO (DUF488 family)